ncbi:hypothetical protein Tco_1075376 [Tanacetum coccineum]
MEIKGLGIKAVKIAIPPEIVLSLQDRDPFGKHLERKHVKWARFGEKQDKIQDCVFTGRGDGVRIYSNVVNVKDKEEIEEDDDVVEVEELGFDYFDKFPTRNELAYHKYITDFLIVEDISSVIDPCLSQVVLGKPFVEVSNMTYDLSLGIVRFTNEIDEIAYKMPHKIEQFHSLSNMEKEHKQSLYFRNEEDKRREVEYMMNKILRFYKECLELGPDYLTGMVEGSSETGE